MKNTLPISEQLRQISARLGRIESDIGELRIALFGDRNRRAEHADRRQTPRRATDPDTTALLAQIEELRRLRALDRETVEEAFERETRLLESIALEARHTSAGHVRAVSRDDEDSDIIRAHRFTRRPDDDRDE